MSLLKKQTFYREGEALEEKLIKREGKSNHLGKDFISLTSFLKILASFASSR
jgi:hypothetical protein